MAGDIRIGISGWRYAGWRGVFYPPKLPQRRELEFAAGRFRSIEINGTHYSLQRPKNFLQWAAETPDDFIFSIKGSRFITHMKKLRDIEDAMANFFAQGMLALGPKLGPILWQFPPQFQFDPARFDSFFRVPSPKHRGERQGCRFATASKFAMKALQYLHSSICFGDTTSAWSLPIR
jgi:uncharacterized protein YecE (DUF72 family)